MRKIKQALKLYINYFLWRRTPILVYSMERTGSIAVFSSLEAHKLFVIGSHYLDPKKLATQRLSGSARWASKYLIRKQKPVKIITLVRRPLENMLSTFARTDYGDKAAHQGESTPQEEPCPRQLSEDFRRNYLETDRYLRPLEWFTSEFQSALGINIYEHSFDKQNDYCRLHENSYDVLIMRTELPDKQKAQLIADFVGIPSLKMVDPAVASVKRGRLPAGKPGDKTHYAAKYKALKQNLVISRAYLEAIVDSPHVQHFFTQEERDEMHAKFCGDFAQDP